MELSQQQFFWQERRDVEDRRQRPTRVLHRHGVAGRRSLYRRKSDPFLSRNDHFEKPVWFAALAIIILSVFDYMFTLYILESGGSELNIFMDHVVQQGSVNFFISKYCLTVLAVVILLAHHQHQFFRTIRVETILYGLTLGYFCLICYEIWIVSLI